MDRGRSQGRGRDNRPAWVLDQERQHIREAETRNGSSSSPRPRKRVRVETVQEEDQATEAKKDDEISDSEQLLLVMEGDEFVSQEAKESQAAEQRRRLRKQRLQNQKKEAEAPPPTLPLDSILTTEQRSGTNVVDMMAMNEEEKIETAEDDDDGFDMFSPSSVSPPKVEQNKKPVSANSSKHHHQQDWDDDEGYYKATIGEQIDLQQGTPKFRVQGIVGKGVFSTVLKCETQDAGKIGWPDTVGIKLIRHNDTMAKAAQDEIRHLQKLRNCNGIINLHLPQQQNMLEHRGHITMVFAFAPYNLRQVLRKFGRGVGLSLTGVRAYFCQLLQALLHLEKHNLVHADLKPDNILVSEDFSTLQLCDFGSAFEEGSDAIPTPYLVSRFYRAPEVILGLLPTIAIDLWSVAATIGELFLGKVLFDGRSNNDMLLQFMNALGVFSNRLLRQHTIFCQKFPLDRHFQNTSMGSSGGGTFWFLHKTLDKVTNQPVTVNMTLVQCNFPKTPLQQLLLSAKSPGDSRVELLQMSDLMLKCLALDPSRRIALQDALRHDFFQKAEIAPPSTTKAESQ